MMVAPAPAIGISIGNLGFSGVSGGSSPAAQTVSVTNVGGGTLSGLGASVSYGSGSGWLSASLNTATAPATLTVTANPAALSAGTYTATVAIASGVASNSPQNVLVSFAVAPPPAIGLSPGTLSFSGVSTGTSPAAQTVSVTNTGGGTLSGLSAGISYGSGSGWLSASLNTTTAPATLTVSANPAALSAGTYTATVAVSSGVASNSPQNVGVTFVVAPPPTISLSPGTLAFSGVAGGTSPAGQTVAVTNTGGGTLSGLSAGISYGSGSGWLSASLNTTTAPATLTVTASLGSLAAGTYTATVSVSSAVAANSPQNIGVTFTVRAPAGRLLFVYNTDPTEANSYETLFEAHDWLVTTVAMASTVGYSFSPFDLIVIGSDTGAFENWGTSAEVTAINGSGKKVIGFGEGGYAFFGQLSLTVGFPNGWHGSLTDMIAVTPSSSLYTTPNTVTLGSGNVISVYTSAGDVGIFLPTIPSDIVVIGSEVGDAEHNQHYDVLKQGTRYLLWGYSAPAGNLTANGANLLLNILYFMTH
jgi:hypothetical protein